MLLMFPPEVDFWWMAMLKMEAVSEDFFIFAKEIQLSAHFWHEV